MRTWSSSIWDWRDGDLLPEPKAQALSTGPSTVFFLPHWALHLASIFITRGSCGPPEVGGCSFDHETAISRTSLKNGRQRGHRAQSRRKATFQKRFLRKTLSGASLCAFPTAWQVGLFQEVPALKSLISSRLLFRCSSCRCPTSHWEAFLYSGPSLLGQRFSNFSVSRNHLVLTNTAHCTPSPSWGPPLSEQV